MKKPYYRLVGIVGKRSKAIVIPAPIAYELDIKKGEQLKIQVENNKIIIQKIYENR